MDFLDASLNGGPSFGAAAVKTMMTGIAKRVVGDTGMDGFDVDSSVDYEIALLVPDSSSFSGAACNSYQFNLIDVMNVRRVTGRSTLTVRISKSNERGGR
ncbi:MAG: hypothetical protein ACFWT0_04315 [Bifidobacterium crudilactis]